MRKVGLVILILMQTCGLPVVANLNILDIHNAVTRRFSHVRASLSRYRRDQEQFLDVDLRPEGCSTVANKACIGNGDSYFSLSSEEYEDNLNIWDCNQMKNVLAEYEKEATDLGMPWSSCLRDIVNLLCKYGSCIKYLVLLEQQVSTNGGNQALCTESCVKTALSGIKTLAEKLHSCFAHVVNPGEDGLRGLCVAPTGIDTASRDLNKRITFVKEISVTDRDPNIQSFGCLDPRAYIYVHKATYGAVRNDKCSDNSKHKGSTCLSETLASAIVSKCNKHQYCTINMNAQNFCDPCKELKNQYPPCQKLTVEYECVLSPDYDGRIYTNTLAHILDTYACARNGKQEYCGHQLEFLRSQINKGQSLTKSACDLAKGNCCFTSWLASMEDNVDIPVFQQAHIKEQVVAQCSKLGVSFNNEFDTRYRCGGSRDYTGGKAGNEFESATNSGSLWDLRYIYVPAMIFLLY
eukprot:m.178522 g.178522  ORF g.178522 m.178522 type:complete len:464 (-) comp15469_c0_seq2:988-2379(-)